MERHRISEGYSTLNRCHSSRGFAVGLLLEQLVLELIGKTWALRGGCGRLVLGEMDVALATAL